MDDTTRVLGDRYELRGRLGRGGMAEVFRGFDRVLERDVAVKILSAHRTAEEGFVRRFRREATAAASLNHPNVVAVHDTGSDGDDHYIVMELVEGPTLDAVITAEGPFDVPRALDVMRGVCAALGAAHDFGLVHRDVKPGNIMLTGDGTVKVADFGLARAVSTSTRTSTVYGSAPYMAPEQAVGDDVDHRADIYALGCVLHHMLTGQAPFAGDSPLAIVSQHLHGEPPAPSSLRPDLPAGIDAVVAACLAKTPDGRYPDVGAVLADLERVAGAETPLNATQVLGEADVPTVAIGAAAPVPAADRAPSGVDTGGAPPADDGGRRPRRSARAFALVAVLALGVSALLLLLALQDGRPGLPLATDGDETSAPDAGDGPEAEDAADADPPEEQLTGVSAVRDVAFDVLEIVDEAYERDQMDRKWRDEVTKYVREAMEGAQADEWGDALDAVDKAREKLNEGVGKREVNTGRARQIHRALDELESVLRESAPRDASPSPSP